MNLLQWPTGYYFVILIVYLYAYVYVHIGYIQHIMFENCKEMFTRYLPYLPIYTSTARLRASYVTIERAVQLVIVYGAV